MQLKVIQILNLLQTASLKKYSIFLQPAVAGKIEDFKEPLMLK